MLVCNYGDYRASEGRAEGIVEGRKEGREEGREEGLMEGREEGIKALVTTIKDLINNPVVAAEKLIEKFQLLPSVAKEKVDLYWNA